MNQPQGLTPEIAKSFLDELRKTPHGTPDTRIEEQEAFTRRCFDQLNGSISKDDIRAAVLDRINRFQDEEFCNDTARQLFKLADAAEVAEDQLAVIQILLLLDAFFFLLANVPPEVSAAWIEKQGHNSNFEWSMTREVCGEEDSGPSD